MIRYCAMLRAVNVGGTGKLPMAELRALCEAEGFAEVSTWIASGNVLFSSELDEAEIVARLEARLASHLGARIGVLARTSAQLRQILEADPFHREDGSKVGILVLPSEPDAQALAVRGQAGEEIAVHGREIFVRYPDGMGRSKLRFKAMDIGTMRNRNTVAKLVSLLEA